MKGSAVFFKFKENSYLSFFEGALINSEKNGGTKEAPIKSIVFTNYINKNIRG